MAIKALSYIGVNSDKFEDWSDYSQKNLGMQQVDSCLLYTSPSPRDVEESRMPSSA